MTSDSENRLIRYSLFVQRKYAVNRFNRFSDIFELVTTGIRTLVFYAINPFAIQSVIALDVRLLIMEVQICIFALTIIIRKLLKKTVKLEFVFY